MSEEHDFLPVAGHPDDDECTHRADGTDATYCGQPRAWHDHHPRCYQNTGVPEGLPDDLCDCRVLRMIAEVFGHPTPTDPSGGKGVPVSEVPLAESDYTVPVGPAWNGVTRAWVAKTLSEHRLTVGRCTCGWRIPPHVPMLPAQETHVAEVLVPREAPTERGD